MPPLTWDVLVGPFAGLVLALVAVFVLFRIHLADVARLVARLAATEALNDKLADALRESAAADVSILAIVTEIRDRERADRDHTAYAGRGRRQT